jgi:hypothetical protein
MFLRISINRKYIAMTRSFGKSQSPRNIIKDKLYEVTIFTPNIHHAVLCNQLFLQAQ